MAKEAEASAIVAAIEGKPFVVGERRETERIVKPKAPFTTSKLQQAAANRLGYTSKKTMAKEHPEDVAQLIRTWIREE